MTDRSRLGRFKVGPFLLIVSFLVLAACAPPSRVQKKEWVPISPEITVALESFDKADRLFQEQAYPEALAIYEDYLRQSPNGSLADAAWMKTGLVYMAMEDYAQARKAFRTVVSDYPEGPFVEDASFNVMLAYYKEGDYSSAARYARSALRLAKATQQEFRINYLLGYTYSADKQFKDAITSYMDAYEHTSRQGRAEILGNVKEIITYLKEPELNSLLDVYKHRVPGGYLRLQLAKEYASEDRIQPAIRVLADFMDLYPNHDQIETATTLMEELTIASMVDRHLIGCVLPLSGTYEAFGARALQGIEIALDQFNAQHRDNPIHLLIRDSKGDPDEAAKVVETLARTDGVAAIIGPMITSESAALKAQALKVPIVTLTQKPTITEMGDYVFRDFLTLSLQVKAIVGYAVDDLGLKKFAIVYPDEQYGISFMNQFWDELIRRGAEVVGLESYGPEQTDFGDAVKKLVGLYYPRPKEPERDILAEQQAWALFSIPEEGETWEAYLEQPPELLAYTASDQIVQTEEEPNEWQEEEQEDLLEEEQYEWQEEAPEDLLDEEQHEWQEEEQEGLSEEDLYEYLEEEQEETLQEEEDLLDEEQHEWQEEEQEGLSEEDLYEYLEEEQGQTLQEEEDLLEEEPSELLEQDQEEGQYESLESELRKWAAKVQYRLLDEEPYGSLERALRKWAVKVQYGLLDEEPYAPGPIIDFQASFIPDTIDLDLEQSPELLADAASDQEETEEEEQEEVEPIVDFDAIFIPDSYKKAGLIAPQFLYHDVADVLLLGTNLWHSDKLIEMARSHVQGAVVPDGFFVNSPSTAVKKFVKTYKKVFGSPPAFLEAQAYDAASILFQAVNRPDVWSRRTVKTALLEVKNFQGVTGVTSFNETGDVEKELYLLKVKGRRFVQIKP